jgi:hypothetical protein
MNNTQTMATRKTWPSWTAWLILPLMFLFHLSWITVGGLHHNHNQPPQGKPMGYGTVAELE